MAKADSVFMSITDDLQEGSILIKHLEEIFQHENQFIFIWELSKCAAQGGLVGLLHGCSD